MSILKKAKNTMAYGKLGILGFPGSGKTFTATEICCGIAEMIKNKKIAYFDTETGSDFMLSKLEKQGFEVFQVKSRSFSDLCQTIQDCVSENVGSLIIDSITHVWRDLCDSYDQKLKRNGRLQFQDWAVIKAEWKKYTDLYVNSPLHIIACGRAGYEYDYDFNQDGSKDLIKTATRMKVESEFAFEPSLVIEMERTSKTKEELKEHIGKADYKSKVAKQQHKAEVGSKWIHRAYVLKDRTDTLNGKIFDYPTFENFKSHFDALNVGGEHLGVDTSKNSQELFDVQGRPEWQKTKEQCKIIIEEITGILDRYLTTSKEDKVAKAAIKKNVFGTYSDTAIEGMPLEELQKGLQSISSIFSSDDIKKTISEIVEKQIEKGK